MNDEPIDLESLLRDAISGVAVSGYARGIDLSMHLDLRLPARGFGDRAVLAAYLRQALGRTIQMGRIDRVALALWHEDGAEGPGVTLEAARRLTGETAPTARLTDLWALPLGAARAQPHPLRTDTLVESVLVPLPLMPDADAPPLATRRGTVFRGRNILHVRDILLDVARMRRSLACVDAEFDVAPAPEEALALARRRVAAGDRVDVAILDAAQTGREAIDLARAFRDDPALAGIILVLLGLRPGHGLPEGDMALFDAAPAVAMPWRSVMDVLHDLFEARLAGTASTRADLPNLKGRRILVAEDVPTNQMLLHALLTPTGAALETVSGGEAAVRRHVAAPADLIVMDLQMPGTGGLAATRQIRALEGPAARAPIVALTAYARETDRAHALGAGMNAFMAKPVVVAEFYDLLRSLLGVGGGSALDRQEQSQDQRQSE